MNKHSGLAVLIQFSSLSFLRHLLLGTQTYGDVGDDNSVDGGKDNNKCAGEYYRRITLF